MIWASKINQCYEEIDNGSSASKAVEPISPDTLDVSTSVLIPSVITPLDRHGVQLYQLQKRKDVKHH